jgi:phage terminase large subunit-like protein
MTESEKIIKSYCSQITNKKIPAGIYVIKAVKRFLSDLKNKEYYMDWQAVDDFLELSRKLHLADRKEFLNLLPWQLFIIANLIGFKDALDHTRRRFINGAVFVPRKNGKTTGLMYPLLLYDLLKTQSAEAYFFEKDERQADKMMRDFKHMVSLSPEFSETLNYTVGNNIYIENRRIGWFTSETAGIDGYKPSLAVIDEYFCFTNDKPVTAMRYGSKARKNGLVLIITTAGTDISLPAYAEYEKVQRILNGTIKDDTYFGIIFTIDESDDWKTPEAYYKANPSLGLILDERKFINDLNDALITPSHQPEYLAKTLNIWSTGTTSWIPLQSWEQASKQGDKIDFTKRKCYGSFDLSSVGDFTAYTLCFENEDNYYFRHRFYIPLDTVKERYRKENIGIIEWIRDGIVTAIPGPTIDYDYIYEDITKDYEAYDIQEIAYDSWGSRELTKKIEDTMPNLPLIPYPQNLKRMGQPTKQYEKLVLEKKIIDQNPVMKWMVQNVVIKPDANGNYKPLKEARASTKRIDGVITSIISLDRCIAGKISNKITFEDLMVLL